MVRMLISTARRLALKIASYGVMHLVVAILVAFAALPTASSAYVLAVRMGGHGAYVAGLVTVSTLLGMVSVPAWMAVLDSVAG